MRHIFLSYASADRDRARPVVEALEARGWSVWWDRELAIGTNYEEEIQRRLEASRCVVVLWSESSVKSRWVKAEAQDAAERERLFPVFLDPVKAPLEYRYLNGIDLTGWDGSVENAEIGRLDESLRIRLRPAGPDTAQLAAPPRAARAAVPGAPTDPEPAAAEPPPARPGQRRPRPAEGVGEVTAMRLIARELADILERVTARRRATDSRRSPDYRPGEVTVARAISRRLVQGLARVAATRDHVPPSTLALRYLVWSFAVPAVLLLALHAAHLLTLAR